MRGSAILLHERKLLMHSLQLTFVWLPLLVIALLSIWLRHKPFQSAPATANVDPTQLRKRNPSRFDCWTRQAISSLYCIPWPDNACPPQQSCIYDRACKRPWQACANNLQKKRLLACRSSCLPCTNCPHEGSGDGSWKAVSMSLI